MDKPDMVLARLAAGQHGIVSRSQALAEGLTDNHLHRRRGGLLVPMHEGVFRHAAVPLTWRGRIHGAVLATGPEAVASHRSAARLEGLDGVPLWRPEVTSSDPDPTVRRGVTVHRTTLLDARDRTTVDGIPVTTIPRTLLDLGAVVPYGVVEHATQDAIIRKLVEPASLVAVLERVGGRGRRGTAALRSVVRHAIPDEKLQSMLELKLLALIHRLAIEPPELQYELVCIDGRRVRLDFAWPALRIAVEADGHRWHSTSAQLRHDLARSRSIQASGYAHHRYGWADTVESPVATLDELRRILLP